MIKEFAPYEFKDNTFVEAIGEAGSVADNCYTAEVDDHVLTDAEVDKLFKYGNLSVYVGEDDDGRDVYVRLTAKLVNSSNGTVRYATNGDYYICGSESMAKIDIAS